MKAKLRYFTAAEYTLWLGSLVLVLGAWDTANLIPSTVSVTTGFAAVYLTAKRSPYFALAYAANDVVLVVLWAMASLSDTRYVAVAVCFGVFLVNDVYGFVQWRKMERAQGKNP